MKRRVLLTLCAIAASIAVVRAADEKSDAKDPIIGLWVHPKALSPTEFVKPEAVRFEANGKCHKHDPEINTTVYGTWSFESDKDRSRKYKVIWAKGVSVEAYRLSPEDGKIRNEKGQIVWQRAPKVKK